VIDAHCGSMACQLDPSWVHWIVAYIVR
jgi:hypothetical protein